MEGENTGGTTVESPLPVTSISARDESTITRAVFSGSTLSYFGSQRPLSSPPSKSLTVSTASAASVAASALSAATSWANSSTSAVDGELGRSNCSTPRDQPDQPLRYRRRRLADKRTSVGGIAVARRENLCHPRCRRSRSRPAFCGT